jgi:hypothetical protein
MRHRLGRTLLTWRGLFLLAAMLNVAGPASGNEAPRAPDEELQPLAVHVQRLVDAMDYLGIPIDEAGRRQIERASRLENETDAVQLVQDVLDPLCLLRVHINPESRVKVDRGPAPAVLTEHGWTQFLVRVDNEAGVTATLRASSPQALPVNDSTSLQTFRPDLPPVQNVRPDEVRDRWMDLQMFDGRPLEPTLSGLPLEYRIIQIYSRDVGQRAAIVALDVGQGSQDIGFRNDLAVTFQVRPATPVTFEVRDEEGGPTMAAFVITDTQGHVYPSRAKRLEPDFTFHPQVYRGEGEGVRLPAGRYTFEISRGPEYLKQTREVVVGEAPMTVRFELERWVDPADDGWWSGDHHIHAAGCLHYSSPSEGVHPEAMARHIQGEDLKIGANLTWGPGFDYQKQFFTGREDEVSDYPYLLRYDVEVSGFGSQRTGHLVLLGLRDQIYPGGDSTEHWPTLGLNTLRWAKAQGAIAGPAHSGWGLQLTTDELPSYVVPPFDGIGANEYIMQITHEVPGPDGQLVPAVDFMSTVDTPWNWELNMWYHTLNAGFRQRISGETDFPCIYGDRVGLGRSYVKVSGRLTYQQWIEGIRLGRSYVGDGRSHLMDFAVNGVEVGTGNSEVRLDAPGTVDVRARFSAYLPEAPDPALNPYPSRDVTRQAVTPFWHIERGRIGQTRNVKVELVVNGEAVASQVVAADGATRDITFNDVRIDRSSWVALRVPYSSHTNPIWVMVGDRPVRASRESIEWCLKAVDQAWSQKQRFIAPGEMDDALEAYEHARQVYRQRLAEVE